MRCLIICRSFFCFFGKKYRDKSVCLRAAFGLVVFPAFLLCGVSACSPTLKEGASGRNLTLTQDQARISVFLESLDGVDSNLSFRLLKVELFGRDEWQVLELPKIRYPRREIKSQQLPVGVTALSVDTYTKIRLTLSEVKSRDRELLPEGIEHHFELPLEAPLVLAPGESRCLFIGWHGSASGLITDDLFSLFSVRPQNRPQITDLVTVLCRDLATVYQVSPDQNRVIAALGVPENCGEIAYDKYRRRFYAIDTGARALLKYDAVTNRRLDTIALPQTVAPKALALSVDGRYAYISDTKANLIIRVDVVNGFIERVTGKRLRPGRLFYFPTLQGDLLAVLAPSEASVYLLDPLSLRTRFILPVNGRPAGVAVVGDYLFISDISSDKIAFYSIKSGRLLNLIRVGRAPLDLVVANGRVYAAVSGESYLSLLLPPQLSPVRRLRCLSRPASLAISRSWQKIYVVGSRPPQLESLDLQSGAVLEVVPLAGHPDQIILWESR